MNKRAALQLSINAIVILILAITMLGLGLSFMRNIFGSATEEFMEVGGTVKKQMIDQMKETQKIVDISNPQITMKPGEKKQVFIGFKNEANVEKDFQVVRVEANKLGDVLSGTNIYTVGTDGIISRDASGEDCGSRYEDGTHTQVYIEFKSTPTNVEKGDVVVMPINIHSLSSASPGTCIYEIKVDTTGDGDYDKIIELTVDVTT